MDHSDTTASQEEPAGDGLTLAEVGLFALLCVMSLATIITLAIKG